MSKNLVKIEIFGRNQNYILMLFLTVEILAKSKFAHKIVILCQNRN